MGWRDYGGKHFESIFTRFYQGYILPEKFGIYKQKFHLSVLICSGQLTKEAARKELQEEYYPAAIQREDKEYVLKKLDLTEAEFDAFMKLPIRKHEEFPSYVHEEYVKYENFMRAIQPFTRFVKKLLGKG